MSVQIYINAKKKLLEYEICLLNEINEKIEETEDKLKGEYKEWQKRGHELRNEYERLYIMKSLISSYSDRQKISRAKMVLDNHMSKNPIKCALRTLRASAASQRAKISDIKDEIELYKKVIKKVGDDLIGFESSKC